MKKLRSTNTSGVTGVWFKPKTNAWVAEITINSRKKHLGCFSRLQDAAKCRAKAEKSLSEGTV